ncbi:MAG: response regulator [Nitrososphaerales archaeon]
MSQIFQAFPNPLGEKTSSASGPSIVVKKTIMICEDDRDLLRVYTLALRSKYEIISAISGKECLTKYSEIRKKGKRIDALLLDYSLGDTTGDEIATKIRGMNGTKVIMISAFEIESELVDNLKASGIITAFVKKPVTIGSLGVTLDNVLRV